MGMLKRLCRTCFWAGDMFAPKLKLKAQDGRELSVQQFLQESFLNMWEVVAKTLGDLEAVIGFEVRTVWAASSTNTH